jgi:RimJ/RimL family protein N-acetyltransferase
MIHGELVNLRAVERTDASTIWSWFNDPDLMRHWGIPAAATSLGTVQTRIEDWLNDELRIGHPTCLIVDDLEAQSVGLVILSDYREIERSVALSLLIGVRERWGQGLGSDALCTIVDACFSSWHLHRLWLHVEVGNERARDLYLRAGFRHEGTLRDATFMEGAYHDVDAYSLLATDQYEQDDRS